MLLLSPTRVLLAFSFTTLATSSHLFERAPKGCLADNCLRAVTGTEPGQKQTASNRAADCSQFLLKTVTPETVTITSTASFTSSTTLSLATTTTTTTTAQANANKRSVVTATPTAIPAYASPCTSAARYSSACSCAGLLPMSTVTVPAPTITVTVSTTSTTTIDVTSTSTSVTIASPAVFMPPPCTSQSVTFDIGTTTIMYNLIFSGTGVSERPDNPSNDFGGPQSTTFSGSMSACDAAAACASYAFLYGDGYLNFDSHFLIAEQVWSCTAYFDPLSSASDYNVANSNIGAANGYQYWNEY